MHLAKTIFHEIVDRTAEPYAYLSGKPFNFLFIIAQWLLAVVCNRACRRLLQINSNNY